MSENILNIEMELKGNLFSTIWKYLKTIIKLHMS